jgi:hypothetical protein
MHRTKAITNNVLRACEGRDTKALNCKPTTNLEEISELSNYSKTSGFRLHAVSCGIIHALRLNIFLIFHLTRSINVGSLTE